MFKINRFTFAANGARTITVSHEYMSVVLDNLFHPRVICAEPGGTCSRMEEAIRILGRHLEREERLMATAGFSEFAAHKREHANLLRKLEKMKRTLVCGSYDNAFVYGEITEWMDAHAGTFDRPFGDFLRESGTDANQGRGSATG